MPNGSQSTTTVAFSGTPVSGNLVLSVNGITVTIAYNASASALQATLNTLFSPSAIIVTGGPAPTTFTIAWGFNVAGISQTTNSMVDANALAVQPTIVTNNLNVAFITNMAQRQGAPGAYTYLPIPTLLPSEKYNSNGYYPYLPTINGLTYGGSQMWCYEYGAPDPTSQYPTMSVRLVPWPSQMMTVVYDCTRHPNQIMFDATGIPITTQVIDLPLHFHDGVVLYVLMEAYVRAKADTSEIKQLLKDFNTSQFGVESRSLQRQGPERIKKVW